MINRNRVNFDTAGQRVIINPGELTNTGGDNWDITPSGYVPLTSVTPNDIPNTIPERDANCGFSVGNLQIDLTPPVAQTADVGKMVWNDTDGTIEFELKGGNVSIPIGEKEVIRCRNIDAAPMVKGQVVYITGSSGSHKEIKLANASAEATSASTIGVVAETIAVNQEGFVVTTGLVKDINTLALTQGAPVWLSTVSGQMTTTRPTAPNHGVHVGFCVRQHATVGVVYVAIDNGWELDELHNVYITAPATGDVLVYDAVSNYWKNLPTASQPWVLKAGDTMTGNLNITTGNQMFLQGAGNLRLGVGFSAGSFSSANAVVEFKPNASTRFTFLNNVIGVLNNPVLSLCDLDATGRCMALYADTTSSAFIYSNNGNFDITSDTKANIQNGTFGSGVLNFRIGSAGQTFIVQKARVGDTTTPTALLHLKAGTTAATTAPLKFTSGNLMTAAEAGAVEFLTDKAYLTITTGTSRKELALNDAALTAGQQPTTTTNGRLTNSNKYSIYATGTTNGTAGSAVNLTLFTLPNNGDLRFLRITVKAKSAAAMPDIFGRTLDAMWGNGMGTLTQVGVSDLGTAMTVGNLAAATIATTAAGTTLRVTCTDVTGCAAVVTWEVFGEYY